MTEILERLLSEARIRRSLPEPSVRRLLRERAALSQDDIARVLGVTRPTVTRYESGARSPRGSLRVAYGEVLNRLSEEITGSPHNDESPAGNGALAKDAEATAHDRT